MIVSPQGHYPPFFEKPHKLITKIDKLPKLSLALIASPTDLGYLSHKPNYLFLRQSVAIHKTLRKMATPIVHCNPVG